MFIMCIAYKLDIHVHVVQFLELHTAPPKIGPSFKLSLYRSNSLSSTQHGLAKME